MAQKAKKMQDELAAVRITGTSKDGEITLVVTGSATPVGCEISKKAMEGGATAVSEGLFEALLDSNEKAKVVMQATMQEMYAGLAPGMAPPPGM